MRNLFQNTVKSQGRAIEGNTLHLPKPHNIFKISFIRGLYIQCAPVVFVGSLS